MGINNDRSNKKKKKTENKPLNPNEHPHVKEKTKSIGDIFEYFMQEEYVDVYEYITESKESMAEIFIEELSPTATKKKKKQKKQDLEQDEPVKKLRN